LILNVALGVIYLALGVLPFWLEWFLTWGSWFGIPFGPLWLVSLLLDWLYFAGFECSSAQATPGKMALSLVVTNLDRERISFGRATARYFSKILSTLTLCIGYMMIGFTAKKQGLHDMIAGTLVFQRQ
jgi:uncharacterized RDD family membrane protein YckC